MTDDDRVEFGKLVKAAHDYYRRDVSKFTLDAWWFSCQRFKLDDVSRALSQHIQDPVEGKFPILVSHVTAILGGTPSERAVLSWGRLREAMSDVGAYQDVDFGDAPLHAAVRDLGGWPKLCRMPIDELRFVQGRFLEAYRTYATRGAPDGAAVPLTGDRSPDDEYRKRGLPPPAPVRRLAPAPLQLEA